MLMMTNLEMFCMLMDIFFISMVIAGFMKLHYDLKLKILTSALLSLIIPVLMIIAIIDFKDYKLFKKYKFNSLVIIHNHATVLAYRIVKEI